MNKPKVFLTGGDGWGWALDEDEKFVRHSLEGTVEFTDLKDCDVVHSVWLNPLLTLEEDTLCGKRIICHIPGEPFRYLRLPQYRCLFSEAGRFIVRNKKASKQLDSIGISNSYIPYIIDISAFRQLSQDTGEIINIREKWNIPNDRYLIGNFHRDTEGADLKTAKFIKGPDIFVEIVSNLIKHGLPVHVILAGPRRHWIRSELSRCGVPFTFIGTPVEEDDIQINTLPRETLNVIYNILDLYLIASRSEGGPHSLFETSAAKCKVISSDVGAAKEILDPACIYHSTDKAVELAVKDIEENWLQSYVDQNYRTVTHSNSLNTVMPYFKKLYADLDSIPVYSRPTEKSQKQAAARSIFRKIYRRFPSIQKKRKLHVCLWHRFLKPPYGGGNQFMLMLKKGLLEKGIMVSENRIHSNTNVYLLNSIHFDVERFQKLSRKKKLKIIHRIDGPIHLIRGFDREKDELCFRLNEQLAYTTVIQSSWCFQRIVEMGYHPVNPVIINNSVDPDIFNTNGRIPFDRNRKIRLISTSWSGNPRKGGPVYKWIEQNLDWDRFEYTFVGRASESFEKIRLIPPVPSEELADILRQHDIYITASKNDPCSNALIEALACGLPALYLNDGGHPELVGHGGLPFNSNEEIIPGLERIVQYYGSFQRLIFIPQYENVIDKYFTLINEAAESG